MPKAQKFKQAPGQLSPEFTKALKELAPIFDAILNNYKCAHSYPGSKNFTGSKGWFITTKRVTPYKNRIMLPEIHPFVFNQSKASETIILGNLTICLRKFRASIDKKKSTKITTKPPEYKMWIAEIVDLKGYEKKNCYWIEKSEFGNEDEFNNSCAENMFSQCDGYIDNKFLSGYSKTLCGENYKTDKTNNGLVDDFFEYLCTTNDEEDDIFKNINYLIEKHDNKQNNLFI